MSANLSSAVKSWFVQAVAALAIGLSWGAKLSSNSAGADPILIGAAAAALPVASPIGSNLSAPTRCLASSGSSPSCMDE